MSESSTAEGFWRPAITLCRRATKFNISLPINTQAMLAQKLSNPELRVWTHLLQYGWRSTIEAQTKAKLWIKGQIVCHHKIAKIAECTDLCEKTVSATLKALEVRGWVKTMPAVKGKGSCYLTGYRVWDEDAGRYTEARYLAEDDLETWTQERLEGARRSKTDAQRRKRNRNAVRVSEADSGAPPHPPDKLLKPLRGFRRDHTACDQVKGTIPKRNGRAGFAVGHGEPESRSAREEGETSWQEEVSGVITVPGTSYRLAGGINPTIEKPLSRARSKKRAPVVPEVIEEPTGIGEVQNGADAAVQDLLAQQAAARERAKQQRAAVGVPKGEPRPEFDPADANCHDLARWWQRERARMSKGTRPDDWTVTSRELKHLSDMCGEYGSGKTHRILVFALARWDELQRAWRMGPVPTLVAIYAHRREIEAFLNTGGIPKPPPRERESLQAVPGVDTQNVDYSVGLTAWIPKR